MRTHFIGKALAVLTLTSFLSSCAVVAVGGVAAGAGAGDIVRTVVVDEAPGANERTGALRQGAPHGHGPRATERNLARLEHCIPGAHPFSVEPSAPGSSATRGRRQWP